MSNIVLDDNDYIVSKQVILNQHQRALVERICKKCRLQHGILVWHTMGSGKTIATMNILMNLPFKSEKGTIQHKRVIFVPEGTENTWIKESIELGLYNDIGTGFIKKFNDPQSGMQNIDIISYDKIKTALTKPKIDQEKFFRDTFVNSVIVFDESQQLLKIKQDLLKINVNIEQLEYGLKQCFKIIFLTGTPVNTSLYDLQDYFNMLHIDKAGGKSFKYLYEQKKVALQQKNLKLMKIVSDDEIKKFNDYKIGKMDLIFNYYKQYRLIVGIISITIASAILIPFYGPIITGGISIFTYLYNKFIRKAPKTDKEDKLNLELERIQYESYKNIIQQISKNIDIDTNIEFIAELMAPYISFYDYKVSTDFEELVKYPYIEMTENKKPISTNLLMKDTSFHTIIDKQSIHQWISKSDNETKKMINVNDFQIIPIHMNSYQTFIYSKYKINKKKTLQMTLSEENILNISKNLNEGKGQGIFPIMESKNDDIRNIGNITFDCEYFETMQSSLDISSGNQVYIPIPKISKIEQLIKKCQKYIVFFNSQKSNSNSVEFINMFNKYLRNDEFTPYYIDDIYLLSNTISITITDRRIDELLKIVNKDIVELKKIIDLINSDGLYNLKIMSDNNDRKKLLETINIYKHIIIRTEIQYYFLEPRHGPFGLEFYEETREIDPEERYIQITNFYKKWSIYQLSIIKMINNCNTYNIFNCPKFNKVLETMTDDRLNDSRINNNYLPCVYSNFDLYGYKLFSAFLTYKNINHLILESDKKAEINNNIEYLANIPHKKIIKKTVIANDNVSDDFINMYLDIKENYYEKINLELKTEYSSIHLFSNLKIDYEYLNSLKTDVQIDNLRRDYLLQYIDNINDINYNIYEINKLQNEDTDKLGLNRLQLIQKITNQTFNKFNNTNFINKNILCLIISKNIKEGVDFPLSPAIHVLEAPSGYSDSNQIYARILRTINSDQPYIYINHFIDQYNDLKTLFESYSKSNAELYIIDPIEETNLENIFININKYFDWYTSNQSKLSKEINDKIKSFLTNLMLKLRHTVKTIEQCNTVNYDYSQYILDYPNVLIKYYLSGKGKKTEIRKIELDNEHYTNTLNYNNKYIFFIDESEDNIYNINKQINEMKKTNQFLLFNNLKKQILKLGSVNKNDQSRIISLIKDNIPNALTELETIFSATDNKPKFLKELQDALFISSKYYKVTDYSTTNNTINVSKDLLNINIESFVYYVLFSIDNNDDILFYSNKKMMKFRKNDKTISLPHHKFDISIENEAYKNIDYDTSCKDQGENIQCVINKIIYIQKNIKRCKKNIYQYTLNNTSQIYALDTNLDINININPEKFIGELQIIANDDVLQITNTLLNNIKKKLYLTIRSNNTLINGLSNDESNIQYKQLIRTKYILNFYNNNYEDVRKYVHNQYSVFFVYFELTYNLLDKISKLNKNIDVNMSTFKLNGKIQNSMTEEDKNLIIQLEQLYNILDKDLHENFSFFRQKKEQIANWKIIKKLFHNNRQLPVVNTPNLTEQLILVQLDNHMINYFMYKLEQKKLTGVNSVNFVSKILSYINEEYRNMNDYQIITNNYKIQRDLVNFIDFLKKKSCSKENCNIDENPICGYGKLPEINVSYDKPLKFNFGMNGRYLEMELDFDPTSMPVELNKLQKGQHVSFKNFVFKFIDYKSFFDDLIYIIVNIENTKFTFRTISTIEQSELLSLGEMKRMYILTRNLLEEDIHEVSNNSIRDIVDSIKTSINELIKIINFTPNRIKTITKEYTRINDSSLLNELDWDKIPLKSDTKLNIFIEKLQQLYSRYIINDAGLYRILPNEITDYINYNLYPEISSSNEFIIMLFVSIKNIYMNLINTSSLLNKINMSDILTNIDIFEDIYIKVINSLIILKDFYELINNNKIENIDKVCHEKKKKWVKNPFSKENQTYEITYNDKSCNFDIECHQDEELSNRFSCKNSNIQDTTINSSPFVNYLPVELNKINELYDILNRDIPKLERFTKKFQINTIEKCDLLYPADNDFTKDLSICKHKENYCRCLGYNLVGGTLKQNLSVEAKYYINKVIEESQIYIIVDKMTQNQSDIDNIQYVLNKILEKLKSNYHESEINDYFFSQCKLIVNNFENISNKIIKSDIWGFTYEGLSDSPTIYNDFCYIGMGAQLKEEFVNRFPNNDFFIFDLYLWFNNSLLEYINYSINYKTYFQLTYSPSDSDIHPINLMIFDSIIKKSHSTTKKNEYVDIILDYVKSLKIQTNLSTFLLSTKYDYKFKTFTIGLFKKGINDIEINSISYSMYDWNSSNNIFNSKIFLINKELNSGIYYFKMYIPGETNIDIMTSKYFKIGYVENNDEDIKKYKCIESYVYYPLYSLRSYGENFVKYYTFVQGNDNEFIKKVTDQYGNEMNMPYYRAIVVSYNENNNINHVRISQDMLENVIYSNESLIKLLFPISNPDN